MIDRRALAAAYVFDWIVGDPEWFPHPVRLMGKCIELGEKSLRRRGQTPAIELVTGGVVVFGVVSAFYVGAETIISWSYRQKPWLGALVETTLAWTCMASRNLHDEATTVVVALERGDLVLARRQLARIVGRDTEQLTAEEISRAVIETLAESASDGVMAPLFYMAVGGVPLAMAYKAVNTLDSMIGHADENYFYFGKVAARLDDVANFLPARLTALSIAATAAVVDGANSHSALDTWLRDGGKHKSPNAGQPESAMAGALQVRLGGVNFYDGEAVASPLIGDGFSPPSTRQVRQAIRIVALVSALGVAATLLFRGNRR